MVIREVKPQNAALMNLRWHSRLPVIDWSCITRNTYYVCYGAYFNNICGAVGIWSSPVAQNRFKNGKEILELRRLAISENLPKNTASRMISIMVKLIKRRFPEIKKLISYQDTDVHRGTIYKASGWIPATKNKFISWSNRNKTHNPDQSKSDKIRWEYSIQ